MFINIETPLLNYLIKKGDTNMIGISFIFSAILFTIVWMIFRVNYYKKINL